MGIVWVQIAIALMAVLAAFHFLPLERLPTRQRVVEWLVETGCCIGGFAAIGTIGFAILAVATLKR